MAEHQYTAKGYWNTIGSHEAVLAVKSGDRITTSTVDARGWNRFGEQEGTSGNPMTGPFYVEGAKPGDTLVVRFESIEPNREWAWTKDVLAEHVVDPSFVSRLPEAEIRNWRIDAVTRTAQPEEESGFLAGFRLPLAPFFGCFGVAPAGGQAISTATSGAYGGNMDYRKFGVGINIYLPVFAEGALFHLGDGHAAQGDGEIVGTGLEISMDTTFTLSLLKERTINWPRAETDEAIYTAGNARPLDQALQHATTEMFHWLTEAKGYGLSAREASQLLGQCVEYEVGNVYNPAYTMVCKMNKRWLTGGNGRT